MPDETHQKSLAGNGLAGVSLGETEIALAGGSFAAGDRVMLRRNDRRLGVANGDRGIVDHVDRDAGAIDVQLAGRRVRLDAEYVERTSDRAGDALAHGYAITGHSAQGLTCDEAFVLVSDGASREWAYTALSRGRRSNRLYAVERELDDRGEFAPTDGRRRAGRDVVADVFEHSSGQRLATAHARELER
jgi:ATP-dependent exoDNAse (exonuclease V) alpha subunit